MDWDPEEWYWRLMDPASTDRAQAYTIVLAGATIILFALMYAIFQEPVSDTLNATASTCKTSYCTSGKDNISDAWDWLPLFALGFVSIMLIAGAIFKSRGRR